MLPAILAAVSAASQMHKANQANRDQTLNSMQMTSQGNNNNRNRFQLPTGQPGLGNLLSQGTRFFGGD